MQTPEQYAQNGGVTCPNCDSPNIQATDGFDVDAGIAWQNIACTDCRAEWTDHYKLSGYGELTTPAEREATNATR